MEANKIDPENIHAMQDWEPPSNPKDVTGKPNNRVRCLTINNIAHLKLSKT
jgi:hypothetical protein